MDANPLPLRGQGRKTHHLDSPTEAFVRKVLWEACEPFNAIDLFAAELDNLIAAVDADHGIGPDDEVDRDNITVTRRRLQELHWRAIDNLFGSQLCNNVCIPDVARFVGQRIEALINETVVARVGQVVRHLCASLPPDPPLSPPPRRLAPAPRRKTTRDVAQKPAA